MWGESSVVSGTQINNGRCTFPSRKSYNQRNVRAKSNFYESKGLNRHLSSSSSSSNILKMYCFKHFVFSLHAQIFIVLIIIFYETFWLLKIILDFYIKKNNFLILYQFIFIIFIKKLINKIVSLWYHII